jgi:hypothetical protein
MSYRRILVTEGIRRAPMPVREVSVWRGRAWYEGHVVARSAVAAIGCKEVL